MMSLNFSVSLLSFCLDDLSVGEGRVLKSHTITVLGSISDFRFTGVHFFKIGCHV